MAQTAQSLDLATVERLAEKVTALVQLLERTRGELARTAEDNSRLTKEVETLAKRLTAAEQDGVEVQNLRNEREQVRERVTKMLEQLDSLSL